MADLATIGFRADTRDLKRAQKDLNNLTKQGETTTRSVNLLNRAFVALGGALSVRQIIGYSDAYQTVQNRLRIVTDTAGDLERVQSRLLQISNDTRTALDASAVLYSRTSRAVEELGISEERLLRIIETVNKSFAVSGATTVEAENAIRQLSQGLAAGALRGEEFNSVAEQAPEILRAVAKETGMAVGELREFAATGGITADLLIRALENYADEVDNAFAKTQRTFAQSLTVSRNNFIQFVGAIDSGVGAVGAAGDALVVLSENLDTLANIGTAVAILYAGRLAGGITTATVAMAQKTAANIAATRSEVTLASATLATAQAEVANARAAQTALAASLQLATTERTKTAIRAQLAGNTVTLTAATNALTAAQTRYTAAARAASIVTTGLSRAMALLGGPVGIAVAVAGSIWALNGSFGEGSKDIEDYETALANLRGEMEKVEQLTIQRNIRELNEELADLNTELVKQQKIIALGQSASLNPELYAQASQNVADLTAKQKAANDLMSAYFDQLDKIAEKTEEVTKKPVIDDKLAKRIDNARQSIQGMLMDLTTQVDTFGQSESAVLKYRLTVGDLSGDIKLLGAEGQELVKSIVAQQEAFEDLAESEETRNVYRQLTQDLSNQRTELGMTERELFIYQAQSRLSATATADMRKEVDYLAGSLYDEREALEASNEAKERGKSIMEGLRSPMEEYIDNLKEIEQLEKAGGLNSAQAEKARDRMTDQYIEQIKSTQDLDTFTKRAAENMQDAMGNFFFDFMQGELGNLEQSFKQTIDRMVAEALAANLGKALMGSTLGGTGEGLLGGLFNSAAGFFGFGGGSSVASVAQGLPSSIPSLSFDGGGYTGSGSRAGGMDGKGGFMAMMHPNETVIDHSKGQTGGMVVNVTVNGVRDEGGLKRTAAQVAGQTARAVSKSRRNT